MQAVSVEIIITRGGDISSASALGHLRLLTFLVDIMSVEPCRKYLLKENSRNC